MDIYVHVMYTYRCTVRTEMAFSFEVLNFASEL